MDTTSQALTRAERRERAAAGTRASILDAARERLLAEGYASLSTRAVAEAADVPLSQIHYHFGGKQQLILALLEAENARLLARQRRMFEGPEPLSRQWAAACEYLDEDLESGYVRVLQEMIAAGWSDPAIAAAVREQLGGWFRLLTEVAEREAGRHRDFGGLAPAEVAMLMGLPFLGAEAAILLGMDEREFPAREALRRVGALLEALEGG